MWIEYNLQWLQSVGICKSGVPFHDTYERFFKHLDPKAFEVSQHVLKIVIDEIRKRLIVCSPNIENAQIGAVSFIQHFGAKLNHHPHFHIIVADGLFNNEGELQFHEAFITQDDIADTQDCIQRRVLKFFGRRGWFNKESIENLLSYENSGFSLDATVKIQSWDRDGLERLIRYCARPAFASENLREMVLG